MFSFQPCIFTDAHATRRFAANEPVAAATRKTIRRPVPAVTDVRWKLFRRLSSFFASRRRYAVCVTTRLVRRHFYYSAGRRFDAPRRLCKRGVTFAAFFSLHMHARNKYEELLIIKRVNERVKNSVPTFEKYCHAKFDKYFNYSRTTNDTYDLFTRVNLAKNYEKIIKNIEIINYV